MKRWMLEIGSSTLPFLYCPVQLTRKGTSPESLVLVNGHLSSLFLRLYNHQKQSCRMKLFLFSRIQGTLSLLYPAKMRNILANSRSKLKAPYWMQ
eukprot:24272_5